MSIEANKALVRRYREIYRTNQLDKLEEVLAPDFKPHAVLPGLPPDMPPLEIARQVHQMTLAAFPDLRTTTEDLIAEGDKVVERWSQTQTHTGVSIFGVPAGSGKKIRTSGISIYRIANGKIVEHWGEMDLVGVLQQMGAMPAPGGS
jgi:predicted ester cyclase